MRLFNLTDQQSPQQKEAVPQTLRKGVVVIKPGGFFDSPKNFPMGSISGWVNSGKVAVGKVPDWYIQARNRRARKPKEAPPAEELSAESEEKKVEVDVGAMTATVKAGPDGELGTADDEVEIKPKKSKKKRGKR